MSKKNRKQKQKISQRRADKVRAREAERQQTEKEAAARVQIITLPRITGADFNVSANDMVGLQRQIDAIQHDPGQPKRRILFSTEASFLHTGFSTYLREVMKRLHATGKYELAELGSYGASADQDPRAKEIPWKYYPVLPANGVEQAEYQKDYRENQFGKYRLSYALADFRPDIVLLNRDNWMDTHVLQNSLRPNCLVYWMPTVDGFPQQWRWLADYSAVDGLFAYSWFGKSVLETQSRTVLAKRMGLPPLNVRNVMQPGVDINVFKPLQGDEVRKMFGIPPGHRFVGTVMRNQPRKLFTRIIESFRMFKEQYPVESQDVYLLLHTSVPDVGWDIPEAIRQNGLEEFVVFTYICTNCGLIAISNFIGSPAKCPQCQQQSFQTPTTQVGLNDEHFSAIYNLLSVYIQGSIAEGDGMPVNEAKACGVPCLMSDYSALYEKARNGGALPILNETIYTEHETMQWRSLFDRQDLTDKLALLMSDEEKRSRMAKEARQCAEMFYTWDLCAKKWELELDTAKIKNRKETWEKVIEIKSITKNSPPVCEETPDGCRKWLEWCYVNILGRKGIDPDGLQHWTRAIMTAPDKDKAKIDVEKHFRKLVEDENSSKRIMLEPKKALSDPIERLKLELDPEDKSRILLAQPETAGDIFILTGVIDGLKKKYPESVIYVATKPEFASILDGHPAVKKVVEFHDSMLNYRAYESFAMMKGLFDFVFCPFIITQRIPHWIHGGKGEWLGKCYADMCHVEYGDQYIRCDDAVVNTLTGPYITVQSQTRQDPKDYDRIDEIVKKITGFNIVQIGSPKDRRLDVPNLTDLRGKTTPQQLAGVLQAAKAHLGHDSFPMHIAGWLGTPQVVLFGGTYAKQGLAPNYKNLIAIETEDRGPCCTSCHLSECEAKKRGFDKCINNIAQVRILDALRTILGEDNVAPPEKVTISSYMIIRDGIKRGFPFGKAIAAALKVSDEVVVVDGGSTDGTWEKLQAWASDQIVDDDTFAPVENKLKVFQHPWDMDNPTLFGDEKTFARQQCTGTWLIQLDADELIQESHPGQIREIIEKGNTAEVIDLPIFNLYGGDDTARVEQNCWKWRISKNDPNIIHGVHGEARQFDPETMKITMDKKVSDGCEYIYADSLRIVPHRLIVPIEFMKMHEFLKRPGQLAKFLPQYTSMIEQMIRELPVVFHYSWHNLARKTENGSFWDQTFHGRKEQTHNTTADISKRIDQNRLDNGGDMLIPFPFDHPLRSKKD